MLAALLVDPAVAPAGPAPRGSIIVGQLRYYDNADRCPQWPCGSYQLWWGRPRGPFAQMLGVSGHAYGGYMAPAVSPAGRAIVYAAPDRTRT